MGKRARVEVSSSEESDLIGVAAVARMVGVDPSTIYRWVRAGLFLAPMRVRRTVRWSRAELLADLKARRDRDSQSKESGTSYPSRK